ncbi:hypothetical protein DFJ74DRAFT_442323 [Hyaloraphidium curvatum]|nr:hypothetical protein DFJ74DRAFT_442323 [Hyaloraphidium curvatum]
MIKKPCFVAWMPKVGLDLRANQVRVIHPIDPSCDRPLNDSASSPQTHLSKMAPHLPAALLLVLSLAPLARAATEPVWSDRWDVLGPLPAPLRGRHDTFLQQQPAASVDVLRRNLSARVPSEVAAGGFASWRTVNATRTATADTVVAAGFPDLDVPLLTAFYGIAGTEFAAIIAGNLIVPESGLYRFANGNAPDNFFLNSRPFKSDPLLGERGFIYSLEAGTYAVWTHFADWGNTSEVTWPALRRLESPKTIELGGGDAFVPDLVDGRLASRFVSVPIIPTETLYPGELVAVGTLRTSPNGPAIAFQTAVDHRIEALQPFPLALPIDVPAETRVSLCDQPQVNFTLRVRGSETSTGFKFRCQNYSQPFRFTFLDIDGSVQYAMAWAPATEKCPERGCPVIRTYHGNGVEAASDAWTYAYKQQRDAWLLFPTNRGKNGYDWETSGSVNGWKALEALEAQPGVPDRLRSTVKADTKKILYAGHSMGGHGTMAVAVHNPDLAIAMAPASGWLKHSFYVPDYLTADFSHLDHVARGVIQNAVGDSDVDVLAANAVGIPAFLRSGTADDNVPSFNLRRFHKLLRRYSGDQGSKAEITVSEKPGVGHWFDGVVYDDEFQGFFDRAIVNGTAPRPPLPPQFSFSTLNPSTSGSKGGLRIIQTKTTGRIARFHVDRGNDRVWNVTTENVAQIQVSRADGLQFPAGGLVIDGQFVPGEGTYELPSGTRLARRSPGWERGPDNYGPARQVFETGPVYIVHSARYRDSAMLLAQDMFARGRWVVEVRPEAVWDPEWANKANMVLFGGPWENRATRWLVGRTTGASRRRRSLAARSEPIAVQWNADGPGFSIGGKRFDGEGLGVVYLSPVSAEQPERLALVVAGNSASATESLLRFVPDHSEIRVPDYLVCNRDLAWQGYGACQAGGFWDATWRFDRVASFGI